MKRDQQSAPEEGPHGIDRWTSNGYGLCIDGIKVPNPSEKEDENGNKTEKLAPHER